MHIHIYLCICVYKLYRRIKESCLIGMRQAHMKDSRLKSQYGVYTMSTLAKMIGLLCKRALQKRLYSAKETYKLKEPINRYHPIPTPALCVCDQLN